MRKSTARVLHCLGWEVKSCSDGVEALELLRDGQTYDLVVSDIFMPILDGISLASIIAAEFPSQPVLLVSGNGKTLDNFEGPLPRQFGFLQKPFSTEELRLAVTRVLTPHQ